VIVTIEAFQSKSFRNDCFLVSSIISHFTGIFSKPLVAQHELLMILGFTSHNKSRRKFSQNFDMQMLLSQAHPTAKNLRGRFSIVRVEHSPKI